jgi:hypothetical protein
MVSVSRPRVEVRSLEAETHLASRVTRFNTIEAAALSLCPEQELIPAWDRSKIHELGTTREPSD